MTVYVGSGSALERAFICGASVALPHNRYVTPASDRGIAIHAFLEACSKIGRDDALAQVDEEFRDVCEALDLTGLHSQLALAAEVALAYNVETDTCRELGRGAGRIYDDVNEDEIPCTLDIVGVRELDSGRRRGLYTDWKSGFRNRKSISSTTQIDFGALCVSRAFDCDLVEGQLVNVHEDFAPYVQRAVFERFELDMFANDLRDRHREWRDLRARFETGDMTYEYQIGPWCDWCGARENCRGQTGLLRSVLSRDLFDGPLRMSPLPDDVLAAAWNDLHAAQSVLNRMKATILGIASQRRIFLGTTPLGDERWLGPVLTEGNKKIDGEAVFDVIASLAPETWVEGVTGEEVATKATKVTATQVDVKAAIKAAVPKGKAAGVVREIFAQLGNIDGAIRRDLKSKPKEIVVKPGSLPPGLEISDPRQLKSGDDS